MPKDEPTQKTQPKKGEPIEIPVPKRDDVFAVLRKSAEPIEPPKRSRRRKGSTSK